MTIKFYCLKDYKLFAKIDTMPCLKLLIIYYFRSMKMHPINLQTWIGNIEILIITTNSTKNSIGFILW